jgi:hypothetical protein
MEEDEMLLSTLFDGPDGAMEAADVRGAEGITGDPVVLQFHNELHYIYLSTLAYQEWRAIRKLGLLQ